jgi:hypothetical protein
MHDNQNFETQYIIDSIRKQNKIENTIRCYKLNTTDQVRLIEPKKTLKKTKCNVASYSYRIMNISGKSISISAIDGHVKTITRSHTIQIMTMTK